MVVGWWRIIVLHIYTIVRNAFVRNDWILILIHMNHRTRPVKLQYHVSDWMETYPASTTCETLIRHETRLSDPVSTVVISFIVSWDRGTRWLHYSDMFNPIRTIGKLVTGIIATLHTFPDWPLIGLIRFQGYSVAAITVCYLSITPIMCLHKCNDSSVSHLI